MPSGGDTLSARVLFRVGSLITQAQIIEYLNEGLSLIEAAGSYTWDLQQSSLSPSTVDGTIAAPANMDAGKKVSVFNPNNLRIRRVTPDKGPSSSANFINVSATSYNAFLIKAGNPPVLQFYPTLNPAQTVTILYHALAPTLANAGSPQVPWPYQWMDDLLVDYAELDIKRVFNLRGNIDDAAGKRWQARLLTAARLFSSERENTGPLEEQQAAEVEKVNQGVN